jgi:hypothetical protein
MASVQSYIDHVNNALDNALQNTSKITNDVLAIDGMSGTKTRHLYNNLLTLPDARYLEIGTYKGSTVSAAMCNNQASVVCIDNWSEFGVNLHEFLVNFNKFKGDNNATFIEKDCWNVDPTQLIKFNIYMYDGNHEENSHYKALSHYMPCLDNMFIYIVDDWNWSYVRNGTTNAIRDLNLKVHHQREIIVSEAPNVWPDRQGWWNGIAIFVLEKPTSN